MDRHDRLTDLFLQAIEVNPEEREDFLARSCGDDVALREEIESLLHHREKAFGVLGEKDLDVHAHLDGLAEDAWASPDEIPRPKNIGSYKILRVLGRGGMGIVYEAEQDNPRRTVALKIIPPGCLTSGSLRRFSQEARILALLQHPGIAQVFEAGEATSEFGRQPFFAMELIRGVTLLRYVVEGQLATEERLDLFARICDAVHHAHQKGIVHRDLKPGNILVDEAGQPKVLDFGIARITDSDRRVATFQTASQVLGTLSYMSPEQCSQAGSTISASSDVYSLGVILYELLNERLPYDLNGQPLPEAARIIRETEPDFDTSEHRNPLSKDLQTIVAKALEKDAPRRYPTANELGADVRRYLAVEPIHARPASTAYQLMKFARRNRALTLGISATLLALLLGLAGTTWQAYRATEERDRVLRLSDMKRLENLEEEAKTLWPAYPEMLPDLRSWLLRAQILGARLTLHERALSLLRESSTGGEGAWEFSDTEHLWQHDILTALVQGLRTLLKGDARVGTIQNVKDRIAQAGRIEEETIGKFRHTWDRAIASIADKEECSRYDGLQIIPQLGLIPLGQDPDSGLWEFSHLESGSCPQDVGGGRRLCEESGLVLVLIPGGTFNMGAQKGRSKDPASGPNRDPFAQEKDGPVHEVTLDPFFLSKYEMTQGQWQRIAHENKSYYGPHNFRPEWTVERKPYSALLPVDDVSWEDCHRELWQVGLVLPTEAQWEYAARARTGTIWWTGDDSTSLQGVANLADRYGKEAGGPASWQYELELFDGHMTHAWVGSFRANPFGLHDVHGNVWEWCLDGYDLYTFPVREGDGLRLMEVKDDQRIFRGGSHSSVASDARSAKRDYYTFDSSNFDLGVRPARSLDTEPRDSGNKKGSSP